MKFEKVSYNAFLQDMEKYRPANLTRERLSDNWDNIQLPKRATQYSAGYDIRIPIDITIPAGERRVIPTGVRVVFNNDELNTWHLQMYVRSSVGIKQGIVLTNGTGIIDPDYQFASNEGDMMLALLNTLDTPVFFRAGDRVCQAVFCIHGLTEGDKANGRRRGGVGSTNG